MAARAATPAPPEEHIATLIARFDAEEQQLFQVLREALRKRFPTLNELVYDYGKKVVIGYSPTEAGGEGLVALSADGEGLRLYLTNGSALPDPRKLLLGKAGARYMMMESAKELQRPEIEALFLAAVKHAKVPVPVSGKGKVIVKETTASKKAKTPVKR